MDSRTEWNSSVLRSRKPRNETEGKGKSVRSRLTKGRREWGREGKVGSAGVHPSLIAIQPASSRLIENGGDMPEIFGLPRICRKGRPHDSFLSQDAKRQHVVESYAGQEKSLEAVGTFLLIQL